MRITIQPITTIEACRIIERLQQQIWQLEDRMIVPDHILLTIAKEGGIVLLASGEAGEPIGFAYGFPGLTADNHLKLASHQAGVLPAYQNRQVGYQLKLAQRKLALAQNIDLITWTYDPLQARNARLNLHKLGAVCNTYLPNLYGDMRDGLNQGLPSDRFRVDWWLNCERVTQRLTGQFSDPPADCPILNPATFSEEGWLLPATDVASLETEWALVELPADINRLKIEALSVAQAWQHQLRQIFETAFANQYLAVDLIRRPRRIYYLLQSV